MTEKMTRMTQFVKEEIANAITHGIGAILSIPALIILIIHASKHGTASAVVAFTVYGVSMFLLYLFSTLLHSIHHPKVEKIFTILDHSAIYLLIVWHVYSFSTYYTSWPIRMDVACYNMDTSNRRYRLQNFLCTSLY